MITEHYCGYCHQKASKSCSACKASFYCSSRCQALLWKYHRLICGEDESEVLKSPNFTLEEAPLLFKAQSDFKIGSDYQVPTKKLLYSELRLTGSKKQQAERSVELLNRMKSMTYDAKTGRNPGFDSFRIIMSNILSTQGRIGMYSKVGLMPYYMINSFYSAVKDSSSLYYHPLFKEYFTYHSITDIVDQQKKATDANNYLVESFKRLEILTREAEELGLDLSKLYRRELELSRIHVDSTFEVALHVHNPFKTAKKYDDLLGVGYNIKGGEFDNDFIKKSKK